MWISDKWEDFEVIDAADGQRLERWGKYRLIRPDPQVVWHTPRVCREWDDPDATYIRSSSGGGQWSINRLPESFRISYGGMKFNLKPMNFKHTGLFPEQAVNWDYAADKIASSGRDISVLNLFAYTGAASVACAAAGASVCHVDASRGMVGWAKDNVSLNGLSNIRFIVDDCVKFVEREIRRGHRYDAIIMDPPSYGRGPGGEVWKIEDKLFGFVKLCAELLSDKPLFFILNSYTAGLSAGCMKYVLSAALGSMRSGHIEAEELGLRVRSTGYALPCGACARWEAR